MPTLPSSRCRLAARRNSSVKPMPRHCSHCGLELREVGDFRSCWITVYECPGKRPLHDFLEVGDPRWTFPLLDLNPGVKDRLVNADPALVELAVSRIRMIDYKTISIVDFEKTLLGAFSEPGNAAGQS
ncbi:hypothetical protein KM317_01670 [Xanthomonas translucens pv. arrhenatheri]|nr:hypothetical protein [Xanthomonas translucens]UKE77994.1 hypothetical protein KM317_01670 [Xanthomonas translucens pv. arrhenatheri]